MSKSNYMLILNIRIKIPSNVDFKIAICKNVRKLSTECDRISVLTLFQRHLCVVLQTSNVTDVSMLTS